MAKPQATHGLLGKTALLPRNPCRAVAADDRIRPPSFKPVHFKLTRIIDDPSCA
jgi:hypothetical protein